MPWDPEEFKDRHFNKASGGQAKKASSIANAMLRSGADEGVAIATGIARAKGQPMHRRAKALKKRGLISDRQGEKRGL